MTSPGDQSLNARWAELEGWEEAVATSLEYRSDVGCVISPDNTVHADYPDISGSWEVMGKELEKQSTFNVIRCDDGDTYSAFVSPGTRHEGPTQLIALTRALIAYREAQGND